LREALNALPETIKHRILDIEPMERPPRREVVDELVELYGSLGGILRRMEDKENALVNYELGSTIEERFNLASTYNRLNTIKYKLLTHTATLDEMQQDLQKLAGHIERQLAIDSKLSDSAWSWADLGDSRLLTGDLDGARQAYRTFVSKAETKSPATALGVLTEVARTLEGGTDPKAVQATKNIDLLKGEFA
jgi:tetratricopeptide (TPR) repeat protein